MLGNNRESAHENKGKQIILGFLAVIATGLFIFSLVLPFGTLKLVKSVFFSKEPWERDRDRRVP